MLLVVLPCVLGAVPGSLVLPHLPSGGSLLGCWGLVRELWGELLPEHVERQILPLQVKFSTAWALNPSCKYVSCKYLISETVGVCMM